MRPEGETDGVPRCAAMCVRSVIKSEDSSMTLFGPA